MRVHHINNINRALAVLQEFGLKLVNISSDDIVEGSPKLTLGLVWLIALSFDGQKLVNSRAVSGIEKSLLTWVRQFTDPYSIKVSDFTSSWSDGAAFLAVIHENIPKFDMNEAMSLHPIARLKMAFDLANRHLQIDQLLDPEDVNTHRPDKKSILMYVMCLYHAIDSKKIELGSIQHLATHTATASSGSMEEMQLLVERETEVTTITEERIEEDADEFEDILIPHPGNITDLDEVTLEKVEIKPNLKPMEMTFIHEETVVIPTTTASQILYDTKSRPASTATNFSVEIGGYQNAVEEVLAMILEAEEVLSRGYPEVTDIIDVKEQFHKHEEFMQRLAEHQQFVGGAIEEGAALIAAGTTASSSTNGLNQEEQNEVRHQMLLLNERWEALRVRALEQQTLIHSRLAQVQTKKIDELRNFLTNTEDRISRMPDIAVTLDDLKTQMTEVLALRADLEDQQTLVDSLSNLVIIVDDESDNFADLEDRLAALGERWSHVVKWTTKRWEKLQDVNGKYLKMTEYYDILCIWIDTRESDVKGLEANEVTEIGGIMRRMTDLQYCEQDINAFLAKLEELESIVHSLPQRESIVQSLLEKIEDLSDRCDALKQILDIQKIRIESLGFRVPACEKGNVIPDDWEDFMCKFDVDSERKLEVTQQEQMSPQLSKKRKIQRPEKLQKLDEQISGMIDVVENINYELSRTQLSLYDLNEMKNKMEVHKIDAENTTKMIKECEEFGDLSLEKSKIASLAQRADEISTNIDELIVEAQINEVKDKITDMKLILADNRDWFKQHANKASHDEIESKMGEMEAFSAEINIIQSADLLRNDPELKDDFKLFQESWNDLSNAINTLIHEKFVDIRMDRKITQFINEIDHLEIVIGTMDEMDQNVNMMNELKSQYDDLDENAIRTTNKDIIEIWERIPQTLNDKIIKQNTAIENLNHFTNEIQSIRNAITKINKKLNSDVFIFGEIKMLESQRNDYEKLVTDIKKIEIDIISVKNFSEIITNDVHKLNEMATIGHELSIELKKVIDLYESNKQRLASTIKGSEDMLSRVHDTEKWLNDLETTTPKVENSDIKNSNELFQIKSKFQALKETCDKMTVKFRELNEEASDKILAIDELIETKTESKVSYLAIKFTKLNARWNEVTSLVYTRTALLEHVSAQLGEFRTLIASEAGYLDKLETLLRKSPEKAADAEEISEELDVSIYFVF